MAHMALQRYVPYPAPAPFPVPVPQIGRTLSLHDHLLHAFLPWFTTNHFRTQPDVNLVLDEWLRSSPNLLEATPYHPPRERDLRRAYDMVIALMEDAEVYGEGPAGAAGRLLVDLEDEWVDDMRFGSGRAGGKAQRLFRALAELSNASRSEGIGVVLRTFFLGWVDDIAEEEDVSSLAGWCSGVERSFMGSRDKEDCLRTLLALRPDVLNELEGRAVDWMPTQTLGRPVRRWPRRRRAAGRLWWDDENARRIRRLIDEQGEQDHQDRLEHRERRKLDLFLRVSPFDRRARRASRSRVRRSMDRAFRRSRTPRIGYFTDSDEDDRFFMRGRGLHRRDILIDPRVRGRD